MIEDIKNNFCQSCCKFVSEKDIKLFFGGKERRHFYSVTSNMYTGGRNRIGYCPVKRDVKCGLIREPSELEYFIYFTLSKNAS